MSYAVAKFMRGWVERQIHALEAQPVLDSDNFPWSRDVERLHGQIREEAEALLANLDVIPNFDEVLPGQRALNQKQDWKSFFLKVLGTDVPKHQQMCPRTTEALTKIPGLINAFFSILRPGAEISPHRGPYAGILRYHLGVIVPKGDVGIRIDDQICKWQEGKSLIFDDSFEHEAWNRTDSVRVVLFVDLRRPLPLRLRLPNEVLLWIFAKSEIAKSAQKKVLNVPVPVAQKK